MRAGDGRNERRPGLGGLAVGLSLLVAGAVLLTLLGGLAIAGRALAQSTDVVAAKEAELGTIRAEIRRLEDQLDAAKRRAEGIEGELEGLELQLRLQGRRTAEAVAARDLATERAGEAQLEVERLQVGLDRARDDLQRRVAGLYRLGRQGYLRLFLSARADETADGGVDLLSAVRLIRYLALRDGDAIETFRASQRELSVERDRLVAHQEETDAWKSQEEARRQELTRLRREQTELLAREQARQVDLARRAVSLAAQEQELAKFVEGFLGPQGAPLSGRPFQDFRGVLEPPAEGAVKIPFGPRLDPRYKTRVPHNGVELTTSSGADVRSVYPGEVLYAAPFQTYGPTVVVRHPGKVLTLYAGLGELQVSKGDMVSLGSILGPASGRLYFEIRIDGKPRNPADWLR